MTRTDHDVIVIGGGIGGLGTALALAQSGLPVHLLERAPQFSEVGAGLQVGPNAVRALDRLGVLDEIYSTAVFPQRAVISDALTGDRLTTLDLGESFTERFGYPYIVLHRNDVLTPLLDACRAHPSITLENNRTVAEVTDEGERMRVRCEDGHELTAKLVVGADGLNSRVRRLIADDEPVFSGYIAFRGATPVDASAATAGQSDVHLWIGPDVHLMQYPVRSGTMYNQVAVFRTVRKAEGRKDWGNSDELLERFSPMCDEVRTTVAAHAGATAYPNFDKDPLTTFVAGRAVLIGDAAHPMLQYLGQGACQALEDGLTLAATLGGQVDDVSGLTRYDELRVPRTTRCQRSARPWGESWHATDPTFRAYRDRYLRLRAPEDYSELAWLYDDALENLLGPVRRELETLR
ncbi:FAD-dependent oxidoreductase [Microbacterium sp.]|uniref:FAD-dependent oxidoreductase n=1 Tax=Microbacterium sp. TaxID=51671 RepID=UPI0035624B77